VKFNPITNRIEGLITGELGDAVGEVRKMLGNTILKATPFNLSVAPYSLAGSYAALIENGGVPTGRAKLVITGPGVYSAQLELQGQLLRSTKSIGTQAMNGSTDLLASFPKVGTLEETSVRFTISATSDLVTGMNGANTLRGFRLAKPGRSPNRSVTIAFETNPLESVDGIAKPAGSGFATGTLNGTGLLSVRGLLGDGQPVMAALDLSQTNQAVVFIQPYPDKLASFFGGILTIGDLGAPGRGGSTASQPAGLQWRKASAPKSTSYPDGFGSVTPLAVTGRVSRWVPLTNAEGLALSLGLRQRQIAASYVPSDPASLNAVLGQAKADKLPTLISLRNSRGLVRLLPSNSVPWAGTTVPTTGSFSGNLLINAPSATKTPVSGVLLQDASFGNQVGIGFVKIPVASAVKGAFRTAGIRLENN
jgi:hypothetical protein